MNDKCLASFRGGHFFCQGMEVLPLLLLFKFFPRSWAKKLSSQRDPGCVASGKLLSLSVLQFPPLKAGQRSLRLGVVRTALPVEGQQQVLPPVTSVVVPVVTISLLPAPVLMLWVGRSDTLAVEDDPWTVVPFAVVSLSCQIPGSL